MTFKILRNCGIRKILSVVPETIIDNLDVNDENKKSRERVVRNIGIRYRHICQEGQIFTDLAHFSCKKVLENLNWDNDSINALIMVTQSSEYIIPSTSIILQHKLKLSQDCLSFDINLGCSGFTYGLMVASSLLDNDFNKRILLVVGDQSASSGSSDQGREVLFGDACSVTALEYDENSPDIFFDGNSDGSGAKAIYVPEGGKRFPINDKSHIPILRDDGVVKSGTDVWLDGPRILNFSINKPIDSVHYILKQFNLKLEDIYRFYFHQANMMINKTINKKLKLTEERSPYSLRNFGNTSSTSVPITMCMDSNSHKDDNKLVLLCGFGIGLSWATIIMPISKKQILPIQKVPKEYRA